MSSTVAYPTFTNERQTFQLNYAQYAESIQTRPDGKKIADGMQTFFKYLGELPKDDEAGLACRLYEINVILRHPSIKNRDEVFATITESLAEGAEKHRYENRAGNLNDVTVDFMSTILEAERTAGAVINSIWPPATAHSSLVPFRVTSGPFQKSLE
jgi:hypothetical protein